MLCRLDSPKTIVCIGAHADDIEIGCGGTLLQLRAHHPQLKLIWIVMAGDEQRRSEAEASFKSWTSGLANCELHHFEFPDTLFPWHGVEIKQAIHKIAQTSNPDLVFTHFKSDAHQDHRVLSEITWNAFRSHLILEYEIPKYEGDLAHPNVYFPLSNSIAERKIELLMQHFASQRSKTWFDERTFFALLRLRGIEAKANDGWAEAFHGRKLVFAG